MAGRKEWEMDGSITKAEAPAWAGCGAWSLGPWPRETSASSAAPAEASARLRHPKIFTRPSGREVGIRVPTFFGRSMLVGEPNLPQKRSGKRALPGDLAYSNLPPLAWYAKSVVLCSPPPPRKISTAKKPRNLKTG